MLNPTYLEQLPEPVIDLVSELEKEIIADLTKRIVKGKYNTPSAEWMTYKANQLRLSASAVNKIIAKNAKVREKTVRELYTEAVRLALSEDAEIYRYAIKDNIISGSNGAKLNTYFRNIPLNDTFRKGLQNTNGLMRNLTNSMAATANKMLSDAMDLAWLETVSGAFTPDEAVFKAVTDLTGKGLKVVKYDSGRTDQVDVAVRRAIRTSVNKTAGDMQLDLASEMGCDLVEVTSHIGARPSHAEWQGQVYSISGKNPKYKPFSVTGYGTGDGLCGWSCRHSFHPYFEGLSERASIPSFTAEENLEAYTLSQKQRAYERAIRQSKRELAALDSARQNTDDPALKAKLDKQFERKSATLKNREQRLDSFCKNNGLQKDNSRVRTVGFDRSVSQKAFHAAKRREEALQYSGISLSNSDIKTFNRASSDIYASKIDGISHNIYVSDKSSKSAKKAQTLKRIDSRVGKALKKLGIDDKDFNAQIVIVSSDEMPFPGAYNPVSNVLYLNEDLFLGKNLSQIQREGAMPNSKISTIVH
ncbi:MAG: phage minor capsid protein, partial [Oscillospiraceae bacterium]